MPSLGNEIGRHTGNHMPDLAFLGRAGRIDRRQAAGVGRPLSTAAVRVRGPLSSA